MFQVLRAILRVPARLIVSLRVIAPSMKAREMTAGLCKIAKATGTEYNGGYLFTGRFIDRDGCHSGLYCEIKGTVFRSIFVLRVNVRAGRDNPRIDHEGRAGDCPRRARLEKMPLLRRKNSTGSHRL